MRCTQFISLVERWNLVLVDFYECISKYPIASACSRHVLHPSRQHRKVSLKDARETSNFLGHFQDAFRKLALPGRVRLSSARTWHNNVLLGAIGGLSGDVSRTLRHAPSLFRKRGTSRKAKKRSASADTSLRDFRNRGRSRSREAASTFLPTAVAWT